MTAEETAANIISKVGLWWPLAEEDQLRTAAGGYTTAANAIRKAAAEGSAGARLVTGGNSGSAIDAFDKYWAKYDGDCEAGLPATAQAAENVAAALKEFADKVVEAKHKIINLAIEIGATIAVGVGLALFTFGTSAGAAAARTAMLVARGLTIAAGLSGVASTIVATMLVGAAFGAVEGFTAGILAQIGKATLSDGKGISLAETLAWTGFGAGGGALAGAAGLAGRSAVRAMAASDNTLLARVGSKFPGAGADLTKVKPAAAARPTPASPRVAASSATRPPAVRGPAPNQPGHRITVDLSPGRRPTVRVQTIPQSVSPDLIPPRIVREAPLPTKRLEPEFVGENIASNPNRIFAPSTVHYMSPAELEARRVVVINGSLYQSDGKVLNTVVGNTRSSMFVMDESGNLFVSPVQITGLSHHSSFLAGRPVAGAGEIVVEDGKVIAIGRRSGHYRPDMESLNRVMDQLARQGLDVSDVRIEGFF